MMHDQHHVQNTFCNSAYNVSVIIPANNSVATIAETIKSVQRQTFKDWELIVVDDGSSDGTLDVIKDLAKKDNRINFITQSNQGVCSARNTGIKNARFDWLLFLDADDWIADNYLEKMTSVLRARPELDGVHCGWTRVTPEGISVKEIYGPSEEDLFPILARHCPFSIHACVIRKSLVVAVGGFDVSLHTSEDWDLWIKIARLGARFQQLREVMAFYRMRKHSLSSKALQFFQDAITVLTSAHGPDERLKHLNLLYPDGAAPELLADRKLHLTTWIAGYLIGDGQDPSLLVATLNLEKGGSIEPYWAAYGIFDAAIIPNCQVHSYWPILYPQIESCIDSFLKQMELQCHAPGFAKKSKLNLEQLILQNSDIKGDFSLGSYFVKRVEVTEPIDDLYFENRNLERLYCFVTVADKYLGTIELPICNSMVNQYVLKDAIAYRFYWSILGRFFANHIYGNLNTPTANQSFEEIHDAIGWTIFMQQLWDRPNWEAYQFYDPHIEENAGRQMTEEDVKQVEISQDLPDIKTNRDTCNLVFSVAGTNIGILSMPVKDSIIKASEIRAAINTQSGLELCRACVREGLLGRPLSDSSSLAQRLKEAFLVNSNFKLKEHGNVSKVTNDNWISNQSMVLGRRAGFMNSSVARRATLPAETATSISEMLELADEPVIQRPLHLNQVDYIVYTPENIVSFQDQSGQKFEYSGKETNVYGRKHFETLFSKQADPWKYTNPYEQTKYEFTLSLIPKQKINKALELACAEGHFTEQLAPLVSQLVAADISTVALQRAAQRCERFDHISYQQHDLIKDPINGQFDLIICSEVLYYVGDLSKLKMVAKTIAGALLPNGHLVMAHAHQVIDEPDQPGFDWELPFGAKVIGETFANTYSLKLVKEIRTPLYRVQLFQKTKPALFSWLSGHKPSIEFFDQPDPVPEAVLDSVRWNGGVPSSTTVISKVFTERLPILLYHRVSSEGSSELSRYRISPEAFEEQLKYLKESGYYSVSLQEWAAAMAMKTPLPGLAVLFTFDDGYKDFYDLAWPLLKKYGFTATVFLVSEQVGKTNTWDKVYGEELPLMSWEEILELQQEGVEFGSHTVTHKLLTSLTPTEIVLEAVQSRTKLLQFLQKNIQSIAYPYGDTDCVVSHLMGACGYTFGVSTESRLSTFNDDLMHLPRIEIRRHYRLEEFIAKLG